MKIQNAYLRNRQRRKKNYKKSYQLNKGERGILPHSIWRNHINYAADRKKHMDMIDEFARAFEKDHSHCRWINLKSAPREYRRRRSRRLRHNSNNKCHKLLTGEAEDASFDKKVMSANWDWC